jgi:hypothetical protein
MAATIRLLGTCLRRSIDHRKHTIAVLGYPKTRGQRPPDFGQRIQYGIALTRLASEDAAVHKLTTEVNHLLKPQSALREPELAKRVMERMTAAV